MALAKKRFAARVQPSIQLPTMCGNMYCGSVYASLCSLLANVDSQTAQGKRIALFSYGSGLASSLFSFTIRGSTENLAKQLDIQNRLDNRRVVAPEVYDQVSFGYYFDYFCSPITNACARCAHSVSRLT